MAISSSIPLDDDPVWLYISPTQYDYTGRTAEFKVELVHEEWVIYYRGPAMLEWVAVPMRHTELHPAMAAVEWLDKFSTEEDDGQQPAAPLGG